MKKQTKKYSQPSVDEVFNQSFDKIVSFGYAGTPTTIIGGTVSQALSLFQNTGIKQVMLCRRGKILLSKTRA